MSARSPYYYAVHHSTSYADPGASYYEEVYRQCVLASIELGEVVGIYPPGGPITRMNVS